jgi:hypothetical protein
MEQNSYESILLIVSRVIAGASLGSGYDARIRASAEDILRSL